jgi:two-component system NtrC family response regulator
MGSVVSLSKSASAKSARTQESRGFHEMAGTCPAMLKVFDLIRKVAVTDFPVLVTGASGTGKEMVAQAIHQRSPRSRGPLVVVNCGAIPRELMESELFGHERGAFTGAYRSMVGKAELAHRGTLFLDEVGELPLEMQVKLLRFLQEFTFERVGGRESKRVDVRVVAATNQDLQELIEAGQFREDLYYRLYGLNIELPLLKDRGEDIWLMARLFLKRLSAEAGREPRRFTQEAQQALQAYSWPGNVRELINRLRRALVMAEEPWITPKNLGLDQMPDDQVGLDSGMGLKEAMAQYEAQLVSETLAQCRGNVQKAAAALKTSRSAIYNLMNKHEIKPQSAIPAICPGSKE